ncbi:MAG: mono/diheme cytochrome c family protein/predicted Ser/Thr protein kinase [Verrucomicrobiales bacterium]|jgi:mono/diheme cytochrome c family protein/predicted Ser/Thr protein kinase
MNDPNSTLDPISPAAAGAGMWIPPPFAELNEEIEGYEVTDLLGVGGMGAVYQATQTNLEREVAIKILSPALSDDPAFEARFLREAKSMAKLNHPNIVQIYDFGRTTAGLGYFVMEFVDGETLHERMERGELDLQTALHATVRICEALHYAHGQGVIHRDIKPGNVMLGRDHEVKVADFGLAKIVSPFSTTDTSNASFESTVMMGTPAYAAPEQMEAGGGADHRADIYSLGVMIYQMLTGDLPMGAFPPPSEKDHNLDKGFDRIVLRAMQPEPRDRYQTASDLKTELDAIRTGPLPASGNPTFAMSHSPDSRSRRKKKKRGGGCLVAAMSLLLVGLGALAWAYYEYIYEYSPDAAGFVPPAAAEWSAETPVMHVLAALGDDLPAHFVANPDPDTVQTGRDLAYNGKAIGPDGQMSARISAYFVCTDCHNTSRETRSLVSISDPLENLAYAVEHDIPLLQGTTFAGIVNRESWYNDGYASKYKFSPTVQLARKSLRKATLLCAQECSQGRELEEWEEQAILAYYTSLQWTLGDLDLTGAELADLKRRALDSKNHQQLLADLRSRYALKSPATFAEGPADPKAGFPVSIAPDPSRGEQVWRQSCLHCHGAEGAGDYFKDEPDGYAKLARKFPTPSKKGLYGLIRLGTHPEEGKRLYMPNFTRERLSDQQIEDLRAFFEAGR